MMSFGSKSKLSACSLFPGFTCDLCDDVFMPFGLLNSQKKTCMNLKLVSAKLCRCHYVENKCSECILRFNSLNTLENHIYCNHVSKYEE